MHVIFNELVSSVVNHGFGAWSDQTEVYNVGIDIINAVVTAEKRVQRTGTCILS
jgi:hypothetical protein